MKYPTMDQRMIEVTGEGTLTTSDGQSTLRSTVVVTEGEAKLQTEVMSGELYLRTLEHVFGLANNIRTITVEGAGSARVTREEFFQTPGLWHKPQFEKLPAELWERQGERPHPKRNNLKDGTFYQRFIPAIGKTVSFRGIDPVKDLDTFHGWHNQPRVAFFWELAQTKVELQAYMQKIKADAHMVPTFVEFDGVPVGYYEMYWTLEDRLGPYYEADAYDRGFHFLIGEKDALGFANTDAIVKSALHYLFLDDPRTRRVMAEPRHDNKKVLRYAESSGWKKLKEFDFPHKRAALMEVKRENFFNGERL